MIPIISAAVSFILSIVDKLGYLGILAGMTLESSFFPFPSEVLLIPAGALISQGKMGFIPVLIFAILGSLIGALINYFIAFTVGRRGIEKLVSHYGKIFFISKAELDKTDNYFKNHGRITTFIGRLLPGIRQLISLPAGFSKMNLTEFCIFTSIGAGSWSFILIMTGWLADKNYTWISEHPAIITLFVILISVSVIIFYILLVKKRRKSIQTNKALLS